MAENAKQAWSDVGEKFSSWGRQVAERYREAGGTESQEAEESRRELERAAKELMDGLSRGFTAISGTLRDEQAKQDLGDAVSAIGDAISATVNEVSEGLRSGTGSGKQGPSGRSEPPGTSEPPEPSEG
jgi:signal transduction histidine kinase